MKRVFVRNNGMGWYVRRSTIGWSPTLAHPDPDRERVIPWRGDAITTLVAFLAAETRRLAPAVEVTPSGLDEFHPDTTHNPSSAASPGTVAA